MPRLLLLQTLCFSPIVDTSFGMDFCVCLESLRERIIRSKRLSFLCNFRKKGREEKHKILLYTINCALGYRLHTQSRDFYVWSFFLYRACICQLKNGLISGRIISSLARKRTLVYRELLLRHGSLHLICL